jgi:hypothetical protein
VTDVRDVGDGYPIRYEARNTDTGALTDATVALTLTSAAGVTTPSPTHTGTGLYDYTIPLSTSGPWYWRWDVSGAVVDIAYGSVLATIARAGHVRQPGAAEKLAEDHRHQR